MTHLLRFPRESMFASRIYQSQTESFFANSIMTMDYRTDRLNVHVDDNMKVKGVSFG
ncbi:hypothetical protein BCV71DRAFT_15013 [Rhizopus microsporus]|uniref:Uncharacterized protein n=1 Tax=Rhizopus microsporus TaxID=58291 RepID=A0A1X0RX92_RHIZD|nr:hypothetical protein BCV71DRAFT_15013 [Rhizopus microsporus]